MSFEIRFATEKDSLDIIKLFSENGNFYNWSKKKWSKYYMEYPYDGAKSIIVRSDKKIVGHYGVLPIKINSQRALLGLHAYVSVAYRDLKIITMLLKKTYEYAVENKFKFICGFSNHQFSEVLKYIFKWKVVGYLNFDNATKDNINEVKRKYCFEYNDSWYAWKFGCIKKVYSKVYKKDNNEYIQILKIKDFSGLLDIDNKQELNYWNPNKYMKEYKEGWNQPFLIKNLSDEIDNDMFDINNWYIEMGDSDTFEY